METGKIKEISDDIKNLFFLTQNKIIKKEKCLELLNGILKEVGFETITPQFFDENFQAKPQAPPQPTPIPPQNIQHQGQHHEIKVDVAEGEQQVAEVQPTEEPKVSE